MSMKYHCTMHRTTDSKVYFYMQLTKGLGFGQHFKTCSPNLPKRLRGNSNWLAHSLWWLFTSAVLKYDHALLNKLTSFTMLFDQLSFSTFFGSTWKRWENNPRGLQHAYQLHSKSVFIISPFQLQQIFLTKTHYFTPNMVLFFLHSFSSSFLI